MNFKSTLCLPLFAALALAAASASANPTTFSTLEERMTGQEFRETGLHKLSDEELAALNRWIRQRSLAEEEAAGGRPTAAAGPDEDRRGLRDQATERSAIQSRIVGSFEGWRGQTEFELENGQVWRQTAAGTFAVRRVENPQVTITPGMFGAWYLRVEGHNSRVRVERTR